MMAHLPSTGPNRKDDGFRLDDSVVEKAISEVMKAPKGSRILQMRPGLSVAASMALLLGLGLALNEAMKPEPCVTFACQLESLSDEELAGMMELMEDASLLEVEDESWTTLY